MSEYGYEVTFVSGTPDYLQCPLCHLVMREPLLIVNCGHKFCGPCFRRLREKTTAANNNQQLMCPVDNAVVDTSQVVPDLGLSRVIGCLVQGCHYGWKGWKSWNGWNGWKGWKNVTISYKVKKWLENHCKIIIKMVKEDVEL
jgi:hypothetical protein